MLLTNERMHRANELGNNSDYRLEDIQLSRHWSLVVCLHKSWLNLTTYRVSEKSPYPLGFSVTVNNVSVILAVVLVTLRLWSQTALSCIPTFRHFFISLVEGHVEHFTVKPWLI